MASSELKISTRKETGSAVCRRLRAQDQVPGVIYGHGQPPVAVAVSQHDLQLLLAQGARLLDISLEKKREKVLVKEVQHDHLGINIVHVDLVRVSLDEKIRLEISIELRGAVDAASHGGGVVEQQLSELEVECLASNIPETIQVPVGKLALGDIIRVKDLPVGQGVTVLSDPEAMVVSVRMVAVEVEAEAEAVVAEPEAGEPEVIGKEAEEQAEQEEK